MKKLLLSALLLLSMVSCVGQTETEARCVYARIRDRDIFYRVESYTAYYENGELYFRLVIDGERNFAVYAEASVLRFVDCQA